MSCERSFSWSCCGSVTTSLSVIVIDSGLHKAGRVSIPLQSMLHSPDVRPIRSEEHTSELQSRPHLVCRLLLEKKKTLFRCHETVCVRSGSSKVSSPRYG